MSQRNAAPSGFSSAQADRRPGNRAELDALIAEAERTEVTVLTKRWLFLEADYCELTSQERHVGQLFNDRLLGSMIRERSASLAETMSRQGRSLADLRAQQVADIFCKYFVRQRMMEIASGDSETPRLLYRSIRADLEYLGIDIDRALGTCREPSGH